MGTIQQNLEAVRERIERAAAAAGRDAGEIALVAISKTFPAEAVAEAADAGQRLFGENRVQEAETKIGRIALQYPAVQWHLVGHLQSNKTRRAAELFHMVHSIDNARLAARLGEAASARDACMPVLIQVDIGQEPTKFGADPNDLPAILVEISPLRGIRVEGLMVIPPFLTDPERVRPYFARLRGLRDALQDQQPGCLGKGHLSMGMSHDFEAAIKEGATIIRVGTAIFGERA